MLRCSVPVFMLGFLWNLPTPLSTSYLGGLLLPLSVKPSISCYLTQRTLLPLTFSFFILFYFSSFPFATHLFLCDFPNSLTTPYYPTRYAPRYLIQNSPLVLTYKRKTFVVPSSLTKINTIFLTGHPSRMEVYCVGWV